LQNVGDEQLNDEPTGGGGDFTRSLQRRLDSLLADDGPREKPEFMMSTQDMSAAVDVEEL
jgi:hypothetical protein